MNGDRGTSGTPSPRGGEPRRIPGTSTARRGLDSPVARSVVGSRCSRSPKDELDLLESTDPVAPEPRAEIWRYPRRGIEQAAEAGSEPERRRRQDGPLEIGLREPCEAHPLELERDAGIAFEH